MKSLVIVLISMFAFSSAHAEVTSAKVKKEKILEMLKVLEGKPYNYSIKSHTLDINFDEEGLIYVAPLFGQMLALAEYGKAGDQDNEEFSVEINKNGVNSLLECKIQSEKTVNEEEYHAEKYQYTFAIPLYLCSMTDLSTEKKSRFDLSQMIKDKIDFVLVDISYSER